MNRSAFLDMINGGIILGACTPFFTTSIIFLKFIWVEVRSRDKSWIFFFQNLMNQQMLTLQNQDFNYCDTYWTKLDLHSLPGLFIILSPDSSH